MAFHEEHLDGTVAGCCPACANQYDPVPHLAQLIQAGPDLARTADSSDKHRRLLASLLTGPWAALRGGLLLDEPGRQDITAEAALRELLGGAR